MSADAVNRGSLGEVVDIEMRVTDEQEACYHNCYETCIHVVDKTREIKLGSCAARVVWTASIERGGKRCLSCERPHQDVRNNYWPR